MSDAFYFFHSQKFKKHNTVLAKAYLSQTEIKLLLGGIYYAMIRDSIDDRKKAYKLLLAKLNKVVNEMR